MGCGIQSRPSLPPPMLLLSDLELCQLKFVSHIHRCCSDIQTTTASVFALKHEWKLVVTLHKPRSRPCSSFKARTCKMLVHLCPDLEVTCDYTGRQNWAALSLGSLENKESADGELFQICRGGHDFGGKVAKRLGIMICGEDSSKTHFDR